MEQVIFDTDVFIEIFNQNQQVFSFINENIQFENIATTAITECELILSANNKLTQQKIEKSLKDVKVYGINATATHHFTILIKKYHLSHSLKMADCLIAAICIENKLPLFTLNTKDFRFIPGLKLIDHSIKPVKKSFWN